MITRCYKVNKNLFNSNQFLLLLFVNFDVVNAGSHLEGPFINPAMKGAHKEHLMRQISTKGAQEIEDFYGSLDHVSIITLAPELAGDNMEAIKQLVKRNIVVSIGKQEQLLSH